MSKYEYTSENIHRKKDNDAYFRLNFLYQASLLFQSSNIPYAQFFKKQMTKVAEKVPIRMTPQMKQTHCKKCQTPITQANFKVIKTCDRLFIKKDCPECGYKRKIFLKKLK